MNCEKINELISEYIDGLLSDEQNGEIAEHLSVCEGCKRSYELIKRIVAAAGDLPVVEPPEGFSEQVLRMARIEATLNGGKSPKKLPKIKKSYIFAGATAASLAFALLFIAIGGRGGMGGSSKSYESAAVQSAAPAAAPAPAPMAPAPVMEESAFDAEYGNGYGGYMVDEPQMEAAREQMAVDMAAGEFFVAGTARTEAAPDESALKEDGFATQKIIKTASYSVEVTDFDSAAASVQQLADFAGGFIESFSSNIYTQDYSSAGTRRDLKRGYICLRLPQNEYESAKIKIEDLGKITSTSESVDNISGVYADTAARLEVKRAEERRLLELYAKAEKIEDLIALEARLTYVRQDIEGMLSQLQSWDRSVSFSTINLSIDEVTDYSEVQPIDPSLGESVREGVNRSIDAFTRGVERLIIGIAENSVAILIFVVAAVIILAAAAIIKKRRGKNGDY